MVEQDQRGAGEHGIGGCLGELAGEPAIAVADGVRDPGQRGDGGVSCALGVGVLGEGVEDGGGELMQAMPRRQRAGGDDGVGDALAERGVVVARDVGDQRGVVR